MDNKSENSNGNADPISTKGIGSRINVCAERVGGKRSLSHMTRISESQLHRYISEQSQATIDPITRIASAANVSLVWLATGKGLMQQEEGVISTSDEFALVPLYDVEVSAGHGAHIEDEQVISEIAFRRDWLRAIGLNIKHLVSVTAHGDSMEPTIKDGDLLLVDTKETYPVGDGVYVIKMDGGLVVKRLQRIPPSTVRVKSDNPSYSEFEISLETLTHPELAESYHVIGRVVWTGRRM